MASPKKYDSKYEIESIRSLKRDLLDLDDPLPSTCSYGSAKYWDRRYTDHPQAFDWYIDYGDGLRQIIEEYCVTRRGAETKSNAGRVLVVGAGNSTMSHLMALEGYGDITSIDFSGIVVAQMRARHHGEPPGHNGMAWEVADCTNLPYADGSFGCAVDKGTIDSVLCSESPAKNAGLYSLEMDRILADDGVWIVVSRGRPEEMIGFFEDGDARSDGFLTFDCTVHAVLKPNMDGEDRADLANPNDLYYVYVNRKDPLRVNAKAAKNSKQRILGAPAINTNSLQPPTKSVPGEENNVINLAHLGPKLRRPHCRTIHTLSRQYI